MKPPKILLLLSIALYIVNSSDAGWFAHDDPTTSFKAGIAKLEQRKVDIFGAKVGTITYVVKKTDSALNSLIGFIRVQDFVEKNPYGVAFIDEFYFSYDDGKWTVNRCIVKVTDSDNGYSPRSSLSLTDPKVQKVQDCFR